MAKRMILMLAFVVLVIGGLGFVKYRQIEAATKVVMQPPPEAVTTIVAKQEKWPSTLNVIGTMEAVQGVTVSADLPGTVARIGFESGQAVNAGDVLVELDTRQERAQLANVEAQRDLAKINYARMQELVKQGVISRQEYDSATAQQKATEAQVERSAPPLRARPFVRPSRAFLEFARSIWDSTWLPARPSFPCSR